MKMLKLNEKNRPAYLEAVEDHGKFFLARFKGEVGLQALQKYRKKMTAVIEEFHLHSKSVLCDFEGVTVADTSTLAALIQRFKDYPKVDGRKLIFFNIQGTLRSLFEIAHLDELCMVQDTREEAEAALAVPCVKLKREK